MIEVNTFVQTTCQLERVCDIDIAAYILRLYSCTFRIKSLTQWIFLSFITRVSILNYEYRLTAGVETKRMMLIHVVYFLQVLKLADSTLVRLILQASI